MEVPRAEIRPTKLSGAGHDAPVSEREYDDYDRWPIAIAISNVINNSPQGWSTRIAVYGQWGDGKTTVLNFVDKLETGKGNIVVRYSPWGVGNESELWASFTKTLRAGIGRAGIKTGLGYRLLTKAKHLVGVIVSSVRGGLTVVEQAYQMKVPQAVVDATVGKLQRLLSFTSNDAIQIIPQLGSRRVVVFVDDLDRTDPAVTPRLLLTLRELLDLPQFVFVLAFDHAVVSRALERYNPAWGTGGAAFLEKIVDFPVHLPKPTIAQVRKLGFRQFLECCPFVPDVSVEELAGVFPKNPRKLKLFARVISSLGPEAKRHEAGELRWNIILLYQLLRLEDEQFTQRFFSHVLDDQEFSWAKWAFEREVAEEEKTKLDDFIDVEHKHLSVEVRERLHLLLDAWRQNIFRALGTSLEYQISFATNPHHITWGEFKTFLGGWRADKSERVIREFIDERASVRASTAPMAAKEFMETVLGYYSNVLERASNTLAGVQQTSLVQEAGLILQLFEQLYFGCFDWLPENYFQTPNVWRSLVSSNWTWITFRKNPGEQELRETEEKLLVRAAACAPDPLGFYSALEPWKDHGPAMDHESRKLQSALMKTLELSLDKLVVQSAIAVIRTPGGIARMYPPDDNLTLHYLLSAPASPIFQVAHAEELENVMGSLQQDLEANQNAKDYLQLLMAALDHGGRFCSRDDRIRFLQERQQLVGLLWRAVVAFPVQYRFISRFEKMRTALLEVGVNEANLPRPDWFPAL